MKLSRPAAPFERVELHGESFTLDTSGKVLVLPTGDSTKLPKYNEYTLTAGRALPSAGTYTFTNDLETELGILNLNRSWLAIYDPSGTEIDFYLFTCVPTQLKYTVDSSGTITQLVLYPGNGQIYHGQITHSDLTKDSDSDNIPDVFGFYPAFLQTQDGQFFTLADGSYYVFLTSELSEGSLTKFLQSYGMVI